jgi:ubiquinone/menaquinone biosynthesis C-methylase UbiE
MSDTIENDYVLGTDDEEIARLGLQHRVWRPRVLGTWRRAGFRAGQTILDAGSGPGFASLDLADIVGPDGRVIAVERSRRFLDALASESSRRGLANITPIEGDLDTLSLPRAGVDAVWCRWVLAFVIKPRSVLQKLADVLKPGGTLVLHEYFEYGTWRMTPPVRELEEFVTLVMTTWREARGEPNIGVHIPRWLHQMGLRIESTTAIVEAAAPGTPYWEWLNAFIVSGLGRLTALNAVDGTRASEIRHAISRAAALESRMITPGVLEILATKV